MTRPIRYLSLFAGIGGFDLGLDRAGMTCLGQVEIDPFCRAVLTAHWPEVPKHDDIRTTADWWTAQPRPAVDVVAGGFPCQPVSVAGRKLAQDDPRWLWPHMARLIATIRPRWVIAENVPGLLRRGFGEVLRDLAALGFDAEWDCVSAAALGANHRRDRVFLVAFDRARVRVPNTLGLDLRLVGQRGGQQHAQPWPAFTGHNGAARHVADTDREAGRPEAGHPEAGVGGQPAAVGATESGRRRAGVPDPDSEGRDQRPGPRRDSGGLGEPAHRGGARPVADPDRARQQQPGGVGGPRGWAADGSAAGAGADVADAEGLRWGARRPGRPDDDDAAGQGFTQPGLAYPDGSGLQVPEYGRIFRRPTPQCGWWAVEPPVGRVANGIPRRVDRLRSLGNAIVPQVAEHVARLVIEADQMFAGETEASR